MKPQEVKATNAVVNVKLQANAAELEEVVVVGYGTQKKRDVTSSITKIKGDALQGLVTPSFESQLAGRAAGVQVTAPTGIIGQAPKIRIRGVSSINSGTDPLYVVDGMPIYSSDPGSYTFSNSLGDINPNDIESYDILKDGAATAIYGSRGANGVVLITTKKGKKGDAKVSYNSTIGFSNAVKRFELLNTEQFLQIANEKRSNMIPAQPAWAAGSSFDTDWQDIVMNRNAVQIEHNLSLSGANDKTNYYLSLGYNTQDGISKNNNLNRYSFKTNIEHKIKSWMTLGGSIGVTKTDYNGLSVGRNSISGSIFNATRQLPNVSPYDSSNITGYNITPAGNVGQGTNLQAVGANLSNIAYVLDKNKFQSNNLRILASANIGINFSKDLQYKFQANVDNTNLVGFLYYDPFHGDGRGSNGRVQNDNTVQTRWNLQNSLTYNKTFADVHNLNVIAVAEHQKERNQFYEAVGTDLADAFYNQGIVTSAYGTQSVAGGITEAGFISYLSRASYNYKQKYFLQGSFRRDGISRLSSKSRWGVFPGYSAGWNISKEKFMEGVSKYLNDFKVRGSYATVGNVDIGIYPYKNLTSASQYGTSNGIGFTQFGNDALQWETSKKLDYGFDFGIFKNKIKFTYDYFRNDIDGLILREPQAASLGIPGTIVPGVISKNIGSMQSSGHEFVIDANIIDNENFKWNVTTNLTLQKSVVISLPSGADIVGGSTTDQVSIGPNIIIRENESPNALFGYQYWGVNPANGNPVYVKANGGLVQGNINTQTYVVFDPNNPSNISTAATLAASDRKILGNTIPTYFGGLNSTMNIKNFDIGFLIRFSGGNKVFNSTRRELLNQDLNNNSTEILGRWQSTSNPGDGWTPRMYAGRGNFVNLASSASTRFVEDGDFISLDNVSLGYSMPKAFLQKIKIDKIRFYLQAQNIFILTKYKGINPEMESFGVDINGTPRSKTISMGINVNL
jgi:TonB-linked SusC/RagA family outer membrane protein